MLIYQQWYYEICLYHETISLPTERYGFIKQGYRKSYAKLYNVYREKSRLLEIARMLSSMFYGMHRFCSCSYGMGVSQIESDWYMFVNQSRNVMLQLKCIITLCSSIRSVYIFGAQ